MSTTLESNDDNLKAARTLTRLWMESQPAVLSFICAAIPRFYDAEDVLQNTAMAVAENFAQYDPARPFVAWAIGIARFRIADYYRLQSKKHALLDESGLDQLATAQLDQFHRLDERREALDECLKQIAPRGRTLLEGRYLEDLKAAELAQRIGSTTGSVRVTLSRIRTQLLECIEARLAQGGPT